MQAAAKNLTPVTLELLDRLGTVPDAHRALVSGFGMVNYDRGVCTGAAVLEQEVVR